MSQNTQTEQWNTSAFLHYCCLTGRKAHKPKPQFHIILERVGWFKCHELARPTKKSNGEWIFTPWTNIHNSFILVLPKICSRPYGTTHRSFFMANKQPKRSKSKVLQVLASNNIFNIPYIRDKLFMYTEQIRNKKLLPCSSKT